MALNCNGDLWKTQIHTAADTADTADTCQEMNVCVLVRKNKQKKKKESERKFKIETA